MHRLKPWALGVAIVGALSCKTTTEEDDACTPGGDGSYVDQTLSVLGEYCQIKIEGGKIVPRKGVVAYDVATPLFSDYAAKSRTVWVPPGKQAKYNDAGQIEFPVGTIVTKSFALAPDMRSDKDLKWVETRVMVRGPEAWYVATYEWDDAQKKAEIRPGGLVLEKKFVRPDGKEATAQYLLPGQIQCKKCHEQDGKAATIGLRADQLNHDFTYPDGARENQLAHWAKVGLMTGGPADGEVGRPVDRQRREARPRVPGRQLCVLSQRQGRGAHLGALPRRRGHRGLQARRVQDAGGGRQGDERLPLRRGARQAREVDPDLPDGADGARDRDARDRA